MSRIALEVDGEQLFLDFSILQAWVAKVVRVIET